MATINAAHVGTFVSRRAFQAFVDTLAPLSAFATDFRDQIAGPGDTVNVPVYDANTGTQDFVDYEDTPAGATSNIQVVIDKHKVNNIVLSDVQIANSSAANMADFAIQAGADLAKTVFQDILSVVTIANYANTELASLASAFDTDDVIDLKNTCDGANMPNARRSLVLDTGHFNALLKDTAIKSDASYGTDTGIRQGMIPSLVGFTPVYSSTGVPANGAENIVGFATTPSAVAVAMRYLNPARPEKYDRVQRLVDPGTGIVIGMREHYQEVTGNLYVSLEANYGYAVGQSTALTRVVSS